MQNNAQSQVVK